jgi:hypothetical protein
VCDTLRFEADEMTTALAAARAAQSRDAAADVAAAADAAAAANTAIATLQEQCSLLTHNDGVSRARIALLDEETLALRQRSAVFDALSAVDGSGGGGGGGGGGDLTAAEALAAAQQRLSFYETQLRAADDTVSQIKQTWHASQAILAADVDALDKALAGG